jgi:hypothetical protein
MGVGTGSGNPSGPYPLPSLIETFRVVVRTCVATCRLRNLFFNDLYETVQSLLIEQKKNYKTTTLKGRNQKKEKKLYYHPHTDSVNTQTREKANTVDCTRYFANRPLNLNKSSFRVLNFLL